MSVELFEHNKETYGNIIRMFDGGLRVGIVQPTGSGKSFLFLKWIEDNPQEKFLVLSPSNEIFVQLKEYAAETDNDDLLNNTVMISYQSLLNKSEEELKSLQADKIIIDEFHRTGAELWGPVLQYVLDLNNGAQILGATATPVRYLDGGKNMAEEVFDNRLARYMTLGEAVAKGILPTPVYIPVWYDYKDKIKEYSQDIRRIDDSQKRRELEKMLDSMKRHLENSYGAKGIFKKHMVTDHGKYIVFCRNYEHILEMKSQMRDWLSDVNGNLHTYVSVSLGSYSEEQLAEFKNDNSENAIKLLFTVDRLNEGVHVKNIDGVIMLRPTISPIIYLQQMGRALAAGNKKPIIFDMVNNYQNVQTHLNMATSMNVFEFEFLNAMESEEQVFDIEFGLFDEMVEFNKLFFNLENNLYIDNEQKWMETYDIVKEYLMNNPEQPSVSVAYKGVKIGVWLRTQNRRYCDGTLLPNREKLLREIGIELGNGLDLRWNKFFEAVKEYKAEFNELPNRKKIYKDIRVGPWLNNQKSLYKYGKLSEERKQLLEAEGVEFVDSREKSWFINFELVKQYNEEFNVFPMQKDIVYKSKQIGLWVDRQIKLYKESKLSSERIRMLESIGFEIKSINDKQWYDTFTVLKQYLAEFGREPVRDTEYLGVKIGRWLLYQKNSYKEGKLSEERIKMLKNIGFNLQPVSELNWKKKYEVLQTYVNDYKKLPTNTTKYMGHNIGTWIMNQKIAHKNGKLSKEREEKLSNLGVKFDNKTYGK